VLAVDDKRLHVFHRIYRKRDNALIATGEQMHLYVDTTKPATIAMEPALRAKLDAIRQAHSSLPVPPEAGQPVGNRAKGRPSGHTGS
jgi:carnitine 3-dehydrogenase